MITVSIAINGVTIMARSAVNTGDRLSEDSPNVIYAVDDGGMIAHNPDDGAIALAKKLLDLIVEAKAQGDEK